MALNVIPLPYGLRDVKITPYTDLTCTTLAGTSIDLYSSQTFSFTDAESFTDLRGDDVLITSHGQGPTVAWELDNGGITFEAYQAMAGGALVTTGTTPAQAKTLTKLNTTVRPYFQVEGQVITDGTTGDFHCVLPRCRATGDLNGKWDDGTFWITQAKGAAYGSLRASNAGTLYQFVQNETAIQIPLTPANVN